MSAPELLAYAVVLFIGIPAMLRNWTAVALVGSFLVVEACWVLTRATPSEMLPVEIMCDYGVVIAVLVKALPSRADKFVLALFAPAWAAYAIPIGDWSRYWILWSAGILQFIVAGADAFATWRKSRVARAEVTPAEPLLRWGWVHGC